MLKHARRGVKERTMREKKTHYVFRRLTESSHFAVAEFIMRCLCIVWEDGEVMVFGRARTDVLVRPARATYEPRVESVE